jgi:hypothetical protein
MTIAKDPLYLIVLKSGGVYKFLVEGISMVSALDSFLEFLSSSGAGLIATNKIDEITIRPIELNKQGVMQI